MKMSIGVDLHKTQFTVYFRREGEEEGEFEKYLTNEIGYELFVSRVNGYLMNHEVSIAVESTGNTRYFRNKLQESGVRVVVVNTMKFKVINQSVKKTDRHDARTLAEFLEKDMLPESQLCSEESQRLRVLLNTRSRLVRTTVSIKNQVHGLLLGYGIESKRGQLQSKRERQRILTALSEHRSSEYAVPTVEPLLNIIDNLYEQIKDLEKTLSDLTKDDAAVGILQSIPGVGMITATTIRAYTDDIDRYQSPGKYAAHAGLVPWVQDSNETIRHGHITKRGPVELRTAFVQLVMGMLRMQSKTGCFRIMGRYRAMKMYKGSGISIIATARKMSTVVWTMLKNNKPFDPLLMASRKSLEANGYEFGDSESEVA